MGSNSIFPAASYICVFSTCVENLPAPPTNVEEQAQSTDLFLGSRGQVFRNGCKPTFHNHQQTKNTMCQGLSLSQCVSIYVSKEVSRDGQR